MTNQKLGDALREMMDAHKAEGLDDLTAGLKAADEAGEQIDELIGSAIAVLRMFGKSWADIGADLGISRQAAWERFNPLLLKYEERLAILQLAEELEEA